MFILSTIVYSVQTERCSFDLQLFIVYTRSSVHLSKLIKLNLFRTIFSTLSVGAKKSSAIYIYIYIYNIYKYIYIIQNDSSNTCF